MTISETVGRVRRAHIDSKVEALRAVEAVVSAYTGRVIRGRRFSEARLQLDEHSVLRVSRGEAVVHGEVGSVQARLSLSDTKWTCHVCASADPDEGALTAGVAVPLFGSVWFTLEGRPVYDLIGKLPSRRDVGLNFHDTAVWWNLWVDRDTGESDRPKWRDGSWHPIGYRMVQGPREVLEVREVLVPMPEGSYRGVAILERVRVGFSKLPRWLDVTHTMVEVKLSEGHAVPIPGKGENSWDCDEDAIYSSSSPGASISEGIGSVVASALRHRLKHGGREWKPQKVSGVRAETEPHVPQTEVQLLRALIGRITEQKCALSKHELTELAELRERLAVIGGTENRSLEEIQAEAAAKIARSSAYGLKSLDPSKDAVSAESVNLLTVHTPARPPESFGAPDGHTYVHALSAFDAIKMAATAWHLVPAWLRERYDSKDWGVVFARDHVKVHKPNGDVITSMAHEWLVVDDKGDVFSCTAERAGELFQSMSAIPYPPGHLSNDVFRDPNPVLPGHPDYKMDDSSKRPSTAPEAPHDGAAPLDDLERDVIKRPGGYSGELDGLYSGREREE